MSSVTFPRGAMQVRAEVAKHLRYNPDAEILITGHSLGGALATLCFLDLQLTLGPAPFAPVYIFGAPRVGSSVGDREHALMEERGSSSMCPIQLSTLCRLCVTYPLALGAC